MKIWKHPIDSIIALTAAFVLMGGGFLMQVQAASTGKIYLSPSSASETHGADVSLSIWVTPPSAINSVQVTVNFDSSKLKYVSTSASGSALPLQIPTVGSKSVQIAAAKAPGTISTNSLVAKLTFKALPYSGSTNVTLTGAETVNSGVSTNASVGNATISFKAGSCPSGQTGTPPNCKTSTTSSGGSGSGGSSGGGSTTPTPKPPISPGPVAPKAPTIAVENPQFSQVSLTVTTTSSEQVYIEYGTTKKLGSKTSVSKSAATHTISFGNGALMPATTYYYEVFVKDANGKTSHSELRTVTTQGLTIKITVYDKNHKPLANKPVTLHSAAQTVTTNSQGVATFTGVIPGNHTLTYTDGTQSYTQAITVSNNVQTTDGSQTAPPQALAVTYASFVQPKPWWSTPWFMGAVAVIILLLIGWFFMRRRGSVPANLAVVPATADSVIVGGQYQAQQGVDPAMYAGQPTVPIGVDPATGLQQVAPPTMPAGMQPPVTGVPAQPGVVPVQGPQVVGQPPAGTVQPSQQIPVTDPNQDRTQQ